MRFFRITPPRVVLVQATDADELARLYERAWDGCAGLDPRMVEDQRASIDELRAWLHGGFDLYQASFDGRIVGAVRCSFPTSTCHLDRLAVDPDLRRRGFGQALVQHAIGRARRAGVTRVWAEVSPKMPDALALYRRTGFRESGRYAASYWNEPLLLLELPL
jgi:ribosomal protein S18 acetylase RimI-like enzyme